MNKRLMLSATLCASLLALGACTTTQPVAQTPRSRRNTIDRQVNRALWKLYNQVRGSRELVAAAQGVLVFPRVISAGLVVGGSYGEGALRTGSVTQGYYQTAALAVGLVAGAQSRAMYLLFMTPDSLERFQSSRGWTVGVDASVALATLGSNGEIDTRTLQQPIIGFVLTNAGLMAQLSIEGTKFTRLEL